jgi:ABC-type branched-subunit amino acid transport system ATPase component
MLEVVSLSKSFTALRALQDVSLRLSAGQIVGLIGPNGSGKSTLFDIITGFQRRDEGKVLFNGVAIQGASPHAIARLGLIRTFQHSEGGQRMTALENPPRETRSRPICRPHCCGCSRCARRARQSYSRQEVLALLGLTNVSNEYVGNLSGASASSVDLGRVLIAKPQLCLLVSRPPASTHR